MNKFFNVILATKSINNITTYLILKHENDCTFLTECSNDDKLNNKYKFSYSQIQKMMKQHPDKSILFQKYLVEC